MLSKKIDHGPLPQEASTLIREIKHTKAKGKENFYKFHLLICPIGKMGHRSKERTTQNRDHNLGVNHRTAYLEPPSKGHVGQ